MKEVKKVLLSDRYSSGLSITLMFSYLSDLQQIFHVGPLSNLIQHA